MILKKNEKIMFYCFLLLGFILIFFTVFFFKKNVNLFCTPTQLYFGSVNVYKDIKVAGFVRNGSIRMDDSLMMYFDIIDDEYSVSVIYNGLLPDLFSDGKNVIVIGKVTKSMNFIADRVIVRHDEIYSSSYVKRYQPLVN